MHFKREKIFYFFLFIFLIHPFPTLSTRPADVLLALFRHVIVFALVANGRVGPCKNEESI